LSDASEIQSQLKGAIQRASRAGDSDIANRIREEGRRLVFLLTGLIKATRVYSPENAALDGPSKELVNVISGLIRSLGAIQFTLVDDQIYMNDIRIRIRPAEQPVVDAFAGELSKHHVGGFSIHQTLDAPQVRAMAVTIASHPGEGTPRVSLSRQLAAIGDIQVTGRWRFRIGGDSSNTLRGLDEIVGLASGVLSDAVGSVGANRIISSLPVRRVVIELLEALKRQPIAAAATPLRYRRLHVAERHLISVAGLSILIGRALGFADALLADLGVAALLHDVGYVQAPHAERHAEAGARLLMRQRGFHEAKVRRFLAVLEHHRPLHDPSQEKPPTIFARILRVANDYDVLVAPRPRQVPPLPPPQALAVLWGGRGRQYDPTLVALLVQTTGRYPPGTLLELSDWTWAVSVSGARDKERFENPLVRVVRDPDGRPLEGAVEVDLWSKRAHLKVRRVVDPALSGFDVSPALDRSFGI
jgi:hypothetical protein